VVRAFYRLCAQPAANLHPLATRRASSSGPQARKGYLHDALFALKEGSTLADFS
jgi:hypothetical protein